MKKLSLFLRSLLLLAFLAWSTGCSGPFQTTTESTKEETRTTEPATEDSLLLIGGVVLTVGGVVYLGSRLVSALNAGRAWLPVFRIK